MKQVNTIFPAGGSPAKSGMNDGMVGKMSLPRVGTNVGDKVGVARPGMGSVAIGGRIGALPAPTMVCVAGARDPSGFRQMYANAPIKRHKTKTPQPNPPTSKTSNAGRYFLRDFILNQVLRAALDVSDTAAGDGSGSVTKTKRL